MPKMAPIKATPIITNTMINHVATVLAEELTGIDIEPSPELFFLNNKNIFDNRKEKLIFLKFHQRSACKIGRRA